nr:MAG TPA: hypothetical protein [Caudoviricetes sp.]
MDLIIFFRAFVSVIFSPPVINFLSIYNLQY